MPIVDELPAVTRQTTAEELQDLYWGQQLSTRQIARLFGRSQCWVRSQLNKHHIPCRQFYPSHRYYFEPLVDEFTPGLAWFLGWVKSDGNLDPYRITITITDRDVLEKIKELLSLPHEIKEPKRQSGRHLWTLRFGSMKFMSWAKQKLEVPLEKWEAQHFRHFLRGFFEGDGSASSTLKGRSRICLCNKDAGFLLNLLQVLHTNGITGTLSLDKRGLWYLRFCGKKALKITDFMYDQDEGYFCQRKKDKALKLRRQHANCG